MLLSRHTSLVHRLLHHAVKGTNCIKSGFGSGVARAYIFAPTILIAISERAMLSARRNVEVHTTGGAATIHHTSSADAIAGNDDLLTQILIRLPIRSLISFKCVSKHWLSLISDSHFLRRRNPNPNPVSALILSKYSCLDDPDFFPLDGPDFEFVPLHGKPSTAFPTLPAWIRVLQSCNGLLCCYSNQNTKDKRDYYICNPTAHQFTLLPELRAMPFRAVAAVGLAFDPSKSLHYQVVSVRMTDLPPDRYWIDIYSSETGSWRVSGESFTSRADVKFEAGVFWNCAIHWIGNSRTMVSFDVNQERLRQTPLPETRNRYWYEGERGIRYFGECRDHLHLIFMSDPPTARLNVYEMERDYSRWFVKYQVDLDAVPTAFSDIRRSEFDPSNFRYYNLTILYLVREENDEDSFLVLRIYRKAVRYSFKDMSFKKLCDLAVSCASSGWQCAHQYAESLACV